MILCRCYSIERSNNALLTHTKRGIEMSQDNQLCIGDVEALMRLVFTAEKQDQVKAARALSCLLAGPSEGSFPVTRIKGILKTLKT